MGTLKWIGGFLGWASGGPIGALIGFIAGALTERGLESIKLLSGTQGGQAGASTGGYSYQGNGYSAEQQRRSFMASLLILSSAVIRADGKMIQSEYDYVKSFIRSNFGQSAAEEAIQMLRELNNQEINVYSVGAQIASNMNYSQRLQLFHYLVGIANADGAVCQSEKSVLESIAAAIRINSGDSASIIAMYYKSAESAYSILEISPDATDEEVKSAYRRMAMKYHPDKVASLGSEVQKGAEDKFRKIQEAYETIKKQRNIH